MVLPTLTLKHFTMHYYARHGGGGETLVCELERQMNIRLEWKKFRRACLKGRQKAFSWGNFVGRRGLSPHLRGGA